MKKNILLCTMNTQLAGQIASACQSCALELILIKNGRELSTAIGSDPITSLMLDTAIQEPCVIDAIYLLVQLKCDIPVIVVGDCGEKVLLSIKRIGMLKGLSIYTMHLNTFEKAELLKILNLIDKKSQVINDEVITTALENKQFVMFYQPKIAIKTNKLVGVEALIRWERPNHGLVSPDTFIPVAEESGLIIPMTYWVIGEVFRQYAAWKKKKINLKFAINLSAKILTDIILPNELTNLCNEYMVDPKDICFEITEAAAMHRPDIVLEVLTRIRLKGFSLSIDDFGTGYSSLVELQRLPFTELKIDKSFVSDLAYNQANMHIVRSIISLGRNMDLSMVAEGAETKEAIDKLIELGCDILQGYYISKPLSVGDFLKWYAKKVDGNGLFIY